MNTSYGHRPVMELEVVRTEPGLDSTLRRIKDGFSRHQDERDKTDWQVGRMGRAYVVGGEPDNYVIVKGPIGANEGSQALCDYMVQRRRQRGMSDLNLLRVPNGSPFPAIVMFNVDQSREPASIKIDQTILEGFFSFSTAAEEFVLSKLAIEPLGIRSSQALALLRCTPAQPWRVADVAAARQTVLADFRNKLPREYASLPITGIDIAVPYSEGGVVVRRVKDPRRLDMAFDAAVDGNWNEVARLITPESARNIFLSMAASAGRLLETGIVHLALSYEYQNVTLAGELCDLDGCTISPHFNPHLFDAVNRELADLDIISPNSSFTLRNGSKTAGAASITGIFHPDRAAILHASPEISARSLTEQIYLHYSVGLRFVDLAKRCQLQTNRGRPGTVLDEQELKALENAFASSVTSQLSSGGKAILQLGLEMGFDAKSGWIDWSGVPLFRQLQTMQWPTILGWTRPDRELNFNTHVCDSDDVEHVGREYKQLMGALARSASIDIERLGCATSHEPRSDIANLA